MLEAPSQRELRGLIRDTGQLVRLQMVCGNIFLGNSRGGELISGICNCTSLVGNHHPAQLTTLAMTYSRSIKTQKEGTNLFQLFSQKHCNEFELKSNCPHFFWKAPYETGLDLPTSRCDLHLHSFKLQLTTLCKRNIWAGGGGLWFAK